jgi:LmbE family N-acetylglucosaminyl deacetylase
MPRKSTFQQRLAVVNVSAILSTFLPDLVLMPCRRDPHRDHRDSWQLVTDALSQVAMTPSRLEYAIWLDELGSLDDHPKEGEARQLAFDISTMLPRKRAAIGAHLSQISDLIADDPTGFRLAQATIERLTTPHEVYYSVAR